MKSKKLYDFSKQNFNAEEVYQLFKEIIILNYCSQMSKEKEAEEEAL